MNFRTLFGLAVCACATAAYSQTYDLKNDWSDTNNPNGAWQYREGSTDLPSVANWTPLGATSTQPAWAPSSAVGSFLPAWFQYNGTASGLDAQAGDILMHSNDNANGNDSQIANVLWTSPVTGTISISGYLWNPRNIGRGNNFAVLLNGNELAAGTLLSGDGHGRTNPLDLSSVIDPGKSLSNLTIHKGDTVELDIQRLVGTFGDFAGVSLTINAQAVPEPLPFAILGLGALAIICRRK